MESPLYTITEYDRVRTERDALRADLAAANKRIDSAAAIIRRMQSLETLQYRVDLEFKALEALGKE